MISRQALIEFKAVWREEFGEEIPDDFAIEEAVSLLTSFNSVYRPIKKGWVNDEYEKRNKALCNNSKIHSK